MLVSIVGAMRGRVDGAIRGIDSLINQADDLENVEFVFRFDEDDFDTIDKLRKYYAGKNLNMKFLMGKRHSYIYMNKYWDECVTECSGEYVMTWTDDMAMHPNNLKGWDTSIREFKNQFFILEIPDTTHHKWPTGVVFPRKLFEILGNRLCPNLILDRWFIEILKENDIWVLLDRNVTHYHAWAGKGPRDETFKEGRNKWDSLNQFRYSMASNGFEDWKDFDRNDFDTIIQYLADNPNTKKVTTDKTYFGTPLTNKGKRFWTP